MHSYTAVVLVHNGGTRTQQWHSYTTAVLVHYSGTRTQQWHSYNTVALVHCSSTRTLQWHSYTTAVLVHYSGTSSVHLEHVVHTNETQTLKNSAYTCITYVHVHKIKQSKPRFRKRLRECDLAFCLAGDCPVTYRVGVIGVWIFPWARMGDKYLKWKRHPTVHDV